MKKIFTLLTLALMSIGSAWASSESDLVAITSSTTIVMDGLNGTSELVKNTLYNEGTVLCLGGCGYSTSKGTSTYNEVEYNNVYQIKSNRQLALKINCDANVTIYGQGREGRTWRIGTSSAGNEIATGEDAAGVVTGTVNGASSAKVIYINASSDLYIALIVIEAATPVSEALKSSAAVKVDDAALTLDNATDGYTVDGATITLGSNITYVATPTNVELVKTVTYSDETTKDVDVTVTFDGTITEGYYIGTASIGLTGSETAYTVKAKQATEPTLVLSASSADLTGLKSYQAGSTTVTLTGANLTDGEYNAPVADGITLSPTTFTVADGAVEQEFTIAASTAAAAKTVLTFECGTASAEFTLNYSQTAKRDVTSVDVSASTTWDWTTLEGDAVELTDDTDPSRSDEFLMATLAELTNSEDFISQALTIVAQFPYRGSSNQYFQGNSIKFTTTVPGTVQVWFSNTGSREDTEANRRYLYINGTSTGVYSLNTTMTEASAYVAAGEVVINAYMGVEEPSATMVRINKIVFTPLQVTVTAAGYATYVTPADVDFSESGVKAYAAKASTDCVELSEVTAAPKGTALVIEAAAGTYALSEAAETPAAVENNDLVAGPVTGDGSSYYVLGQEGDNVGFGLLKADVALPATKAYIDAAKFGAGARNFYAFGETTGIETVNVERGTLNGTFNLAGQRVAQPTKGLYIVNGKKVVVK